MAFRRNLWSGELEQFEESGHGRQIIARIEPEHGVTGRSGAVWSKGWRSTAMSVPIEQMEQFNADARRHGTGAEYIPDPKNPGYAMATGESRASRRREMARRNYFDRSGGYGDQSPQNF